MTAPTHVIFAVAMGKLAGIDFVSLQLLSLGALFPDIDHPQSTLGRLFPFLSIPLNKAFSHRSEIHSFFLWIGVCGVGAWTWNPILLIGLGGLSHSFLDCWNLSGVQALAPFSEKVCVLFGRDFRIETGSKQEIYIFILFLLVFLGAVHLEQIGGFRAMIGSATGSYRIAYQRYISAESHICHLKGRLRLNTGKVIEETFLIVGKEGKEGLAVLVHNKIAHLPEEAKFLRADLKISEATWEVLNIGGVAETLSPVYRYDKKRDRWFSVEAGNYVSGDIIGENLRLKVGLNFKEVF